MPGHAVPRLPSATSGAPPCSNPSCGRVLPVENLDERCRKCQSAYCSRGCRISNKRMHKKICTQLSKGVNYSANPARDKGRWKSAPASSEWSPPKGLEQKTSVPFTKLQKRVWLHHRCKVDIYRIIIDAYRLRMDDDAVVDKNINSESVYGGHLTGIPAFRDFIDLARSREGLLPVWWRDKNRVECEAMALRTDEANWHRLRVKLDEDLIKEHYGDETFPAQLRIFAEFVYKTAVGGKSTYRIMKEMAFAERLSHSFVTG
ncbi:hypothetical protein BGZ63DRAFT_197246 [Mariannaea sp. PMI_226]|nr:hypothetical protein BGZ63DRAFT_197246 [Mariannaea sp. PMI_226]